MENLDFLFILLAGVGYFVSLCLSVIYAMNRRETYSRIAHHILLGAVFSHLMAVAFPLIMGHFQPKEPWYFPWGNWFDSFSLFAYMVAIVYAVIRWKSHLPILGVFVLPWVFLALVFSFLFPYLSSGSSSGTSFWHYLDFARRVTEVPTAQGGHLLALHVLIVFFSYALFSNAFGIGIAYLIQDRQLKSKHPTEMSYRLPPLEEMDSLMFRLVLWGTPILGFGLIIGFVWAHKAWGRVFGGDPKEVMALLTWFYYAVFLIIRFLGKGHGRRTAYIILGGFVLLLFTYLGTNFFSSTHGFLVKGGF